VASDVAVTLLNRLVSREEDRPFATLLAVTVDAEGTGVTVVSAGHPPLLLVTGDGGVQPVEAPPNRPLGVTRDWQYRAVTRACPQGSTFMLYTGGLIERPAEDLDAGLARLVRALPAHPEVQSGGLEAIADDVLRRCTNPSDDSALLLAQHRESRRAATGRGGGGGGGDGRA
jgi:serine phosphatase RsbU (regulator of sigma subunit)